MATTKTRQEYEELNQLRSGKTVDIGAGILVKMASGEIGPGDLYVAQRGHRDPQLFTCKKVNHEKYWVVPDGSGYCYDTWECVKIVEA